MKGLQSPHRDGEPSGRQLYSQQPRPPRAASKRGRKEKTKVAEEGRREMKWREASGRKKRRKRKRSLGKIDGFEH